MEPITTVLTGLALAKQGIEFIKSNLDTINDARAIGEQLSNIFQGHQEFNKKRFNGGLKDVAIEMIEYKQQQESLYELQMILDFRFGNGFYAQIQQEYQKRLKEQKEQDRINRIKKRKHHEQILLGALLIAAFGLVGVILFYAVYNLRG